MTSRNCIVLDNAPDMRGIMTGLRCQGMELVASSSPDSSSGAFSFRDPRSASDVRGLVQPDLATGTSKVFLFADEGVRHVMDGLGAVFGGEIVLEDGVACSETVAALASVPEAETPAFRF